MTARAARRIRRRCQRHSQNRDGLGVSELFLAPADDAAIILAARDLRLKAYLLGRGLAAFVRRVAWASVANEGRRQRGSHRCAKRQAMHTNSACP